MGPSEGQVKQLEASSDFCRGWIGLLWWERRRVYRSRSFGGLRTFYHPWLERWTESIGGLLLLSSQWIHHSYHISTQSNPKGSPLLRRASSMRKEYDFSRMAGRKNPHVRRLKKQVTIRLGIEAIEYFKEMSEVTGIPYQSLINSYLTDCARNQRKLVVNWS